MGHIHQIRIKPHTPEWHKFRYDNGIGGSEIATVMATVSEPLSQLVWTPPIKWYLAKIGEEIQEFTGNVESESGHFFENVILHWYKYFDLDNPSQMDMFQRIKANQRINKVVSPKVYITNDKYPGFFYSPDAYAWPFMRKDYKVLAECKNTTSMTARRYLNKVDPAFWIQVQQGLMLTELPEAHLLILVDGRWFEPITIKPDLAVHEKIQEVGSKMWIRVLKAREIKLKYGISQYYGVNPSFFTDDQREGIELLSNMEPELIGGEDELKFVKEMVKPTEEETVMQAAPEQYELCKTYLELGDSAKQVKDKRDKVTAELILSLGGFHKAEFEDKSFFSYKADAKGTMRLYVQDKIIKSNEI